MASVDTPTSSADKEGPKPGGRPPSDEGSTTFASLQVAPYRIIWTAGFLYFLAIFTGMVARGALAKELGGTNTALGLVTLAFGVTSLVATPIGGVLADRLPKRRLLFLASNLLALSSGWIGVTEVLEVTEFWMLAAVSAIQGAAFSLLVPARMAFTAELVGPKLIPNAIALSQISMNTNRVIGPALAGAMLGTAWLGYAGIYLFSAAMSLFAAFWFLRLPPGNPNADRPRRAPLAELRDGFAYGRSDPQRFIVLLLATSVTMVAFPYVAFLPSVSEDFFGAGATGFAWLSLIGAVGGVGSGFVVARTALDRGPFVQFVSGIGFGIGLVLFALAPTLAASMGASFVVGASTAGFQSMNATLALGLSEPAYHGRMQSILQLGFSLFGMASLPLGIVADWVGLRQTLAAMGILTILIVAGFELWRRRLAAPIPA